MKIALLILISFISIGAQAQSRATEDDYNKALAKQNKLQGEQREAEEAAKSLKLYTEEKAQTLEILSSALKDQGYNPSDFIRLDTYESGKEEFTNHFYGDSTGHSRGKFYATYYVTSGSVICKFWVLKLKSRTSFEIGNDDLTCIPSAS